MSQLSRERRTDPPSPYFAMAVARLGFKQKGDIVLAGVAGAAVAITDWVGGNRGFTFRY
jgi:hypothetical protein